MGLESGSLFHLARFIGSRRRRNLKVELLLTTALCFYRKGMESSGSYFWAKTTKDGQLGISVHDHCLNVGCVAEALIAALPPGVRALLPPGSVTLAALHDIGKITLGFQIKNPAWLASMNLAGQARTEAPFSVSDHALVSQVFLQTKLKPSRAELWAVAVGAHHGRPKGRSANLNGKPESMQAWAEQQRQVTMEALLHCLGPLPNQPPDPRFGQSYSDLWLLAGLITMADWVGSNEDFFSPVTGLPPDQSRRSAAAAIKRIGWPGGSLRRTTFAEAFSFEANTVQQAVREAAAKPGLIIVEAPMGCGKTEAALHAAQQLVAGGEQHGIYFALPTQVTSNRIHLRIAPFLNRSLAERASLRLVHSQAWLENDFDLRVRPSRGPVQEQDGDDPGQDVREARSWFASAKQALLAPYGVGTIDQALQGVVAVKHFFVRRFALAGKVVILDEIHSYDIYTGTLVTALVRELMNLGCSVIVLSATLTAKRRKELLEAASCPEMDSPVSYPLITAGTPGASARHLSPAWNQSKRIMLRVQSISEDEALDALVSRSEAGQHVLWIRNTVVEAQQTFRAIRGNIRQGEVQTGLLHSRFPFQRRQELEGHWLERLGVSRPADGPGSILIGTQVVEQSVDIDLDFIISDLAPTDMLLQRMGRLWRHERPRRAAARPEFWVRQPQIHRSATGDELKKLFGRSGRVYAPYLLMRSAATFAGRTSIDLPGQIRDLLEATYADPSSNEPQGWRDLRQELEEERDLLDLNAKAAMQVLGRPTLTVDEEDDRALTRRKGPPTSPALLLRGIEQAASPHTWQLTALDGSSQTVSEHEWGIAAARFLHRWMVRVPRWMVPKDAPHPRWLELHASLDAVCACVGTDGQLLFASTRSTTSYHEDFGVFAEPTMKAQPEPEHWTENDDEFDS